MSRHFFPLFSFLHIFYPQTITNKKTFFFSFQIIRCGDLDSYPLLQNLDVSSCQIVDIEDDALGRLEILISLHLNNNNITRIPSSLPTNLVNLYLQNNQITDIQPNIFAPMVNLEVINLSGNQLMYLPGLPLPRLITLNVRDSGLKSLSQSVVKMSPNLKDLFLDGNPIKCTELLSIAEWATPCRSEKNFDFPIDTDAAVGKDTSSIEIVQTTLMSIDFESYEKQCTCRSCQQSHKSNSVNKLKCASEHLISSSRSTKNKTFTTNEKPPANNDWNVEDESGKTIKLPNHIASYRINNNSLLVNITEQMLPKIGPTTTVTLPEKDETPTKLTVNNVNSNRGQLSGTKISIEQKMNQLNDTGKQINSINHTNIVGNADIVKMSKDSIENKSENDDNASTLSSLANILWKNGSFVTNEFVVANDKIENTLPARVNSPFNNKINEQQKTNAIDSIEEKPNEFMPKRISSAANMKNDTKILRGDLHTNIAYNVGNKPEETKLDDTIKMFNETQTDNDAKFGTSTTATSHNDGMIDAIDKENLNKNSAAIMTSSLRKLNAAKITRTTKDNSHSSILIKSKMNKMLKQSNPEKKQLIKKMDANKTVTSFNENNGADGIGSGVEAYQRDEGHQIKATTSIYQHDKDGDEKEVKKGKDDKRQQSKNQDTQQKQQQQPQLQKKDDSTDRKRYKLEKVNVRHDDKLDNLVVNSLTAAQASVAATATVTFTEQTMTEQKDNNRLIPTATEAEATTTLTLSNIAKLDVMEDVTLLSKHKDNAQPDHLQKQQQQNQEFVDYIDDNHKENDSTTNWNTNKAISKMNGTENDQEEEIKKVRLSPSTLSLSPLYSDGSANAQTQYNNNKQLTDKNEQLKREQINSDHKTNDKVRATTSTTTAIKKTAIITNLTQTITTDKSNNENSFSLLQKALPLAKSNESNALQANNGMIFFKANSTTTTNIAIGNDDNNEKQKNKNENQFNANNNKFSDSKSISTTTASNNTKTINEKNEKAFANLNVRSKQDNKNISTITTSTASHIPEKKSIASSPSSTSDATTTIVPLPTFDMNKSSGIIKNNTNATIAKTHNNGNKSNEQKNMKIKINSSNMSTDNDNSDLMKKTTSPTPIECNHRRADSNGKKCENNNSLRRNEKINSTNDKTNKTMNGNASSNEEELIDDANKNANDKIQNNGQLTYLKLNETKLIENIGIVGSSSPAVGVGDDDDKGVYAIFGEYTAKRHHNNVNRARQSQQLTMENLINREVMASTASIVMPRETVLAQPLNEEKQKPLANGLAHNASVIGNDNQSQQMHININHPKHETKPINNIDLADDGEEREKEQDDAKVEQLLSSTKVNSDNHNFNQQKSQIQQPTYETNANSDRNSMANNDQQNLSNTASSSNGLSEQWNDIRTTSGHPSLFIVIGITIGAFVSLGLIHMYRCRKPCWQRQRTYSIDDDNHEPYAAQSHRDLLPMEVLNSTIRYTDTPTDLW